MILFEVYAVWKFMNIQQLHAVCFQTINISVQNVSITLFTTTINPFLLFALVRNTGSIDWYTKIYEMLQTDQDKANILNMHFFGA